MTVLLAAALAGAAAAVLLAVPSAGRLRLSALTRAAPQAERGSPAASRPHRRAGPPGPAAAVVAGAALVLSGPVAAGVAAAVVVASVRWHRTRLRERSVAAERAGALEACAVLAGELSAGRTPADALAAAAQVAVGPSRDALRAAGAAAGLGGDVGSALVTDASASAVAPVLRSLAACWSVCAASGSGLAASVARLEQGLRSDQAQRRAVETELAGPRATAVLLAVLPLVGLAMAAGLGADPLHVLLHTPVGAVCVGLALALDALGVWWTGHLVARARGAA